MYILTDNNSVIIVKGYEVVEDKHEQGVVWINGAGYGLDGQQIYEVDNIPEYVAPNKYKYVDGEFIINEDYRNPDEEQEIINMLGQELAQLKIQLIMKGVL